MRRPGANVTAATVVVEAVDGVPVPAPLALEAGPPPEPGVHDWTGEEYHADPLRAWGGSASSTTLRKILEPGGPAVVDYLRTHPKYRDAFDFGGAAHTITLGKGDAVVEVEADDWRTKAAKEARDAARAEGKRPLLTKDLRRARALAGAVLAHPIAGRLVDGRVGVPERSVLWVDETTGEYCRAMLDVFPHLDDPAPIAVDVKTTESGLDPRSLARTVLTYGYHQQAAHYLDGLASVGLVTARFVFVFVTKDPPHLVAVRTLSDAFLELGRARNRRALDLWSWCREANTWPGLPPVTEEIEPPAWATYQEEDNQP